MSSLVAILVACHIVTGAQGVDTTVRPKCLVVDVGSIPTASTPRADRSAPYARALTVKLAKQRGFTGVQVRCLLNLWQRESNFRPQALNRRSKAGGVPQILGLDPATPTRKQIQRGLAYITHRYGTPCQALRHHDRHGWY